MDGMLRRARLARSRLCLVVEARPRGDDPSSLLDAALRGGVDVVQLREKALGDDDLVASAHVFRRACDAHGALFVLNDRPDLVERCGADGVHIGQDDADPADARRLAGPDRIVGLSVGTPAELAAVPPEVDYLGVGPVYSTPTKPDAAPAGLELVRRARDDAVLPWFAIGGVELDTVAEVAAHGAAGVAVVRAVRNAADPEAAARALRTALPPADALVVDGDAEVLLPQLDWLESSVVPGASGAAPHTHGTHTDAFVVLDGELEVRLGDVSVRLPSGSCATAPPGLVHAFRNPATSATRILNLHAHGGWARGRALGLEPADYDTFGTDRAAPRAQGIATGPGDGNRLQAPHRLALVKALTPQLSVLEFLVSSGYAGSEEHVHLRHADAFRVLEGALEFAVDGRTVRIGAGEGVVVPPGIAHAFACVGERTRFLNVHAPDCGVVESLRAFDAGEPVDGAAADTYVLSV